MAIGAHPIDLIDCVHQRKQLSKRSLIFLYAFSTERNGSIPFVHVAIDHSHSQQPVAQRLSTVQAL